MLRWLPGIETLRHYQPAWLLLTFLALALAGPAASQPAVDLVVKA